MITDCIQRMVATPISRSTSMFVSGILLFLFLAQPTSASSENDAVASNDSCSVNDDDIRLFGSGGDAGRVEMCFEGTWRYVCSNGWSLSKANVACRQLGFQSAFMANTALAMAFGGDSGISDSDDGIVVSNCEGTEQTLRGCQMLLSEECTIQQAVAAACSTATSDTAASTYPASIQTEVQNYLTDMHSWNASETKRRLDQVSTLDEKSCLEESQNNVSIPTPFHDTEAVKEAFLFPDFVLEIYQKIQADFDDKSMTLLQEKEETTSVELLNKVRWNAFGMDFSNCFPANMTLDQVQSMMEQSSLLQIARDLYLKANQHNALHWFLDSPYRYYSQPLLKDPVALKLFQQLQRDGIVLIEDFGADTDTIVALAEEALAQKQKKETSIAGGGSIVTSRRPIPPLEILLEKNKTLASVISAYQGPSLLHGYKVTHFSHSLNSTDQYNAGMYHHDRVGRRLKLFVFLNDVDCEHGHPTIVAAGSQKLLYYKSEDYPVTRFANEYVEKHYDIIKGCGKRGGGFIFDTHTLHKGTVEGDSERTVVIAEYHHIAKCAFSKEYNLGIPCPGGDLYRTDTVLL